MILSKRKLFELTIVIFILGIAFKIIYKELNTVSFSEVLNELTIIPRSKQIGAVLFTFLSYLVLTIYDVLAFRYVEIIVPYLILAFSSFIGYSLSHNLGFSVFTGGAARYRILSSYGIPSSKIIIAIGFVGILFWMGFTALAGIVLTFSEPIIHTTSSASLDIPILFNPFLIKTVGIICILITLVVLAISFFKKDTIKFKYFEFKIPNFRITLLGILISSIDWCLSASVPFYLLPNNDLSFITFLGLFQIAQVISVISHVPGGIGVFEAIILLSLQTDQENSNAKSSIVASLILYRLLYYIIPLILSLIMFGFFELKKRNKNLKSFSLNLVIFFLILSSSLICPINKAVSDPILKNDRFGDIKVYRKKSNPIYTVIFFSGGVGVNSDGMNLESYEIAEEFAKDSFVITLNSLNYISGIQKEDSEDKCSYIAGEVERLGQSVQKSYEMTSFQKPILVGYGVGATLAYATYAQSPNAFGGLITFGFCPYLPLKTPICNTNYFKIDPTKNGKGILFTSINEENDLNWTSYLPGKNNSCKISEVNDFIKNQDQSKIIELKNENRFFTSVPQWFSKIRNQFNQLAQNAKKQDLKKSIYPIIEVRADKKIDEKDIFVIFLSGDGGWASIDKNISQLIDDKGIPVLGIDSLKFFWKQKSAEEVATALSELIEIYSSKWNKKQVILSGFSFGAEVIPPAVNLISKKVKDKIKKSILLSPETETDFEIHISDWIGVSGTSDGISILNEIKKEKNIKVICLYGMDEAEESLCTKLDPKGTEGKAIPFEGDHHFDGEYEKVVETMLKEIS